MVDSAGATQRAVVNPLVEAARMAHFLLHAFRLSLVPPYYGGEVVKAMWAVASQCLVPVLIVVVPFGMVISLQGLNVLELFGTQQVLGSILLISMFRELGPGLAGIMIAAQAGSSIAAELGSMRVTDEIDAEEVMAVNPIKYLVVPRLLALTVVSPLLIVITSFVGLFGGYAVAVFLKGVNQGVFMANLFTYAHGLDIWTGVIKGVVFGFVIGATSCYKGFHVTGGAEAVGKATNDAVVQSIIVFLGLNYFISTLVFGFSR